MVNVWLCSSFWRFFDCSFLAMLDLDMITVNVKATPGGSAHVNHFLLGPKLTKLEGPQSQKC